MNSNLLEIRDFLEEKYLQYNTPEFIEGDPVAVPHLFSTKEDIEIAGFLTSVISWGRRSMITKAGVEMMRLMHFKPADFLMHASAGEIHSLSGFAYRTFNGLDLQTFIYSLRSVNNSFGSLEKAFFEPYDHQNLDMAKVINRFKVRFFGADSAGRAGKHLPDPLKNSAAKRINMFLRWMVRKDDRGVDFGIWKMVRPSQLICPLDLHSSRVARKLQLLDRKYNDWKAARELTQNLRIIDPTDPVKYDYALFGLGWYEKF